MDYEIVNELTGEIEVFKTSIDIKQLEEYNQWKIDRLLSPATYSPQEYAEYVESVNNKIILENIMSYISSNKGLKVVADIERIING